MTTPFSDDELLAFLDEQLAATRASELESELRASEAMRLRLSEVIQARESGEHSVGEIWRTHRLSCPTRATLGGYLLGVLDGPSEDYVRFHLETIGCRYCEATFTELQQAPTTTPTSDRRKRFFESSIGGLRASDE